MPNNIQMHGLVDCTPGGKGIGNMTSTTRFVRTRLLHAVFCTALAILTTPVFAAAVTPWKTGVGTRDTQNGALLANDLIFVKGNGQSGPRYYPQAVVLRWDPITEPGRYRVTLRARIEKHGASTLALQAWVDGAHGGLQYPTGYGVMPVPAAVLPMSGYNFEIPGQWQRFSLDFTAESGKPMNVGLVYVGEENCEAGTVEIEKASVKLEKLDLPVAISWIRPVKLRYKHAENGALEFRLTNATGQAKTVAVRSVVITDTDQRTSGTAQTFTVPALATISGTVPFAVPAADGGYEAVGELLVAGQVIDRQGDVFAVSDSPFRCMIQGNGVLRVPYFLSSAHALGLTGFKEKVLGNWDQYVKDCTLAIESSRRAYITYDEYFAWAREDATGMTEETDEPYLSGQTFYTVSRKQLLLLNGLFKSHGIAPVAYTNSIPFGWPGFEVIRQRPEWHKSAGFNTSVMEKYFNGVTVSGNVYPHIVMHFDTPSPADGKTYLQYHMEVLAASSKLYGWEAFRYDAGPLSLKHFPIVKAALAALDPPVGVGNNLGINVLGPDPSDDWQIYCRDDSLMMEESINNAFHHETDPHRRWEDFIDYMRHGSHLARSHGAQYTYINGGGSWYSTTLGYAMGGHPWSVRISPFGNCERFMIQYGSYFWDLRTQQLGNPESVLSVVSRRPLWWKRLVSERIFDATHRQVIVPLFNPPAEEEVIGTTPVARADGVEVFFKPRAGEIVTALEVGPEPVSHQVQLQTIRRDGGVAVKLPNFWGWTNVVFDCREE
jgi:hypothetical protein